jgi:hypothetical protein
MKGETQRPSTAQQRASGAGSRSRPGRPLIDGARVMLIGGLVVGLVACSGGPNRQKSANSSGSELPASPSVSAEPSVSSEPSLTPEPAADPTGTIKALADRTLNIFYWGDGPVLSVNGVQQPKIPCGQDATLAPGQGGLPNFPWHVTALGGKHSADFAKPGDNAAFVLEIMPDGRWATSTGKVAPIRPSVCPATRRFDDAATNVHFAIVEPSITTPGSAAGPRIEADITAVLNAHINYLEAWVREWRTPSPDPEPGWTEPDWIASVPTSYRVLAFAQPASDASAGIVSIRIDYVWDVPTADAGPQWVDVLNYDLGTGKRIPISELFTDTNAAVQRISTAVGKDPKMAELCGVCETPDPNDPTPDPNDPTPDPNVTDDPSAAMWSAGYGPEAANFSLWAPTPDGLSITMAWMQLGYAAAGTPSTVVPWDQLRDLVKPNSYLAWYLAGLK